MYILYCTLYTYAREQYKTTVICGLHSQFPILSGNQMTSNVKTASLAECLHHSTWECASIASKYVPKNNP